MVLLSDPSRFPRHMRKAAIQTQSATPIRLQLSQILRVAIENGTFPAGVRIPSERDLAERYGISRASVRESITELIQAGALFRTVGKGTFVVDAPPKTRRRRRRLCRRAQMGFASQLATEFSTSCKPATTAFSPASRRLAVKWENDFTSSQSAMVHETRSRTAEERPPDALWSEALVDTFWIDCARMARLTCWLTSLSRTRAPTTSL